MSVLALWILLEVEVGVVMIAIVIATNCSL